MACDSKFKIFDGVCTLISLAPRHASRHSIGLEILGQEPSFRWILKCSELEIKGFASPKRGIPCHGFLGVVEKHRESTASKEGLGLLASLDLPSLDLLDNLRFREEYLSSN